MRLNSSETACNGGGDSPDSICVLGIGNVLWADEGFGVRCVEALQQRYEFAAHVSLLDGGTLGMNLMRYVQEATHLLIFDAVDYGLAPGTLKRVEDEEVPRFMGAKKMSLHQTGFQEVLSLSLLTGRYPKAVLLVGCQPEQLEDYGGSLRPCVKLAMEEALLIGLATLRAWGAEPILRTRPLSAHEAVTFSELELQRYEGERPSEEVAYRLGDERFVPSAQTV